MQWYSLPYDNDRQIAVIFFTNVNDRQMQWYSLPYDNDRHMLVIFITNDNERLMQWYSLPMIMTDKCSDILYIG